MTYTKMKILILILSANSLAKYSEKAIKSKKVYFEAIRVIETSFCFHPSQNHLLATKYLRGATMNFRV